MKVIVDDVVVKEVGVGREENLVHILRFHLRYEITLIHYS